MMIIPYLICLIAGGGILGFSIVAGGGDGDADSSGGEGLEFEAEADAGLDADATAEVDSTVSAGDVATSALAQTDKKGLAVKVRKWRPFKELRFWTFFAAFFGLAGTLFHYIGVFSLEPVEAIVSAILGIGCGTLSSYVMHAMTARQTNSLAEVTDYEGAIGKVLLPISVGETGKVRLIIRGQISDLPAITMDESSLERGTQVLVSKYDASKGLIHVTKYQKESQG